MSAPTAVPSVPDALAALGVRSVPSSDVPAGVSHDGALPSRYLPVSRRWLAVEGRPDQWRPVVLFSLSTGINVLWVDSHGHVGTIFGSLGARDGKVRLARGSWLVRCPDCGESELLTDYGYDPAEEPWVCLSCCYEVARLSGVSSRPGGAFIRIEPSDDLREISLPPFPPSS